ncbi:MAG: PAS domain-containing protein, partial [Anaerovoracaceae bacterium]
MKQYYVEHFDDTIESLAIVTGGGAFSVALDETFTLIYGSERYYQIHEYTKETMEEQIQNHCIRYVHPDDRKRVGDYCQRCLEERQPRIDWEMRIISAKGDLKYVKCAGVIEKGSKIPLLHGFVIDITETVIAEKKQRKSREMLLAAMEHTELMYWLF